MPARKRRDCAAGVGTGLCGGRDDGSGGNTRSVRRVLGLIIRQHGGHETETHCARRVHPGVVEGKPRRIGDGIDNRDRSVRADLGRKDLDTETWPHELHGLRVRRHLRGGRIPVGRIRAHQPRHDK